MSNFFSKKRGFTLIELLVVVAIIGVLASIVMVALNGGRTKARDAQRISDLKTLQGELEIYFSNNGAYPQGSGCIFNSNNDMWSTWACWPGTFSSTYLTSIPTDPAGPSGDLGNCGTTANCHVYHYCVYNGNHSYTLAVNLENTPSSIPGNASGLSSCATGGPNTYWINN